MSPAPARPIIAASLGDPAGVGPERLIEACARRRLAQ